MCDSHCCCSNFRTKNIAAEVESSKRGVPSSWQLTKTNLRGGI